MGNSITILCTSCNEEHLVRRTNEIPAEVVSLKCNWCPGCENPDEDYCETYVYEEKPEEEDPDQIKLL